MQLLLIGGTPFDEALLIWWNFVARTQAEIEVAAADWNAAPPLRYDVPGTALRACRPPARRGPAGSRRVDRPRMASCRMNRCVLAARDAAIGQDSRRLGQPASAVVQHCVAARGASGGERRECSWRQPRCTASRCTTATSRQRDGTPQAVRELKQRVLGERWPADGHARIQQQRRARRVQEMRSTRLSRKTPDMPPVFADRPVAVIGASPGGFRNHHGAEPLAAGVAHTSVRAIERWALDGVARAIGVRARWLRC